MRWKELGGYFKAYGKKMTVSIICFKPRTVFNLTSDYLNRFSLPEKKTDGI